MYAFCSQWAHFSSVLREPFQLFKCQSPSSAASSSFSRIARSPSVSAAFRRCLSSDTRSKIQKVFENTPSITRSFAYAACRVNFLSNLQAIEADPLVVFMKGTPQVPQCGFSRAVIQIMEVQVRIRCPIYLCIT